MRAMRDGMMIRCVHDGNGRMHEKARERGTMRARERARMGIARCETTVGVPFVVVRVDARGGGEGARAVDGFLERRARGGRNRRETREANRTEPNRTD